MPLPRPKLRLRGGGRGSRAGVSCVELDETALGWLVLDKRDRLVAQIGGGEKGQLSNDAMERGRKSEVQGCACPLSVLSN